MKAFIAVVAGLVLAGCAQEYWIARPGVSQVKLDADNRECLGLSYEKAPEIQAADFIPVFGAAISAGRADDRYRIYITCMQQRGYAKVSEEEKARRAQPSTFWFAPRLDAKTMAATQVQCQEDTRSAGKENRDDLAACLAGKGFQLWTVNEINAFTSSTSEGERVRFADCMDKVVSGLPLLWETPDAPTARLKMRVECLTTP